MESPWKKYKEKNGITPLDLLKANAEIAPDELKQERLAICESCPELIQITKQCRQCGCFMKFKTTGLKAKCPLGKW